MSEFALFNHHGKADAYLAALPKHNYFRRSEEKPQQLDFVLSDQAILGRATVLAQFELLGTNRFFIYPHAARPNLVNDITDEWPGVTAHFVATPAHAEIMRSYGYKKPIHPVGWSLCPVRDFQPRPRPAHVLFAPIHPRCAEVDLAANRAAFDRLYILLTRGHIQQLTVRYYRSITASGLDHLEHPHLHYTPAILQPDWDLIDQVDVVVAHQTFAWIAAARGVPVVMYAEDLPAHLITNPLTWAKNWNTYQQRLAFPLDLLAARDPLAMLKQAVVGSLQVEVWKSRLIGPAFEPDLFIRTLESYL